MQCGQEGPRTEYWTADWHHRDPGIKCNVCDLRPPGERGVVEGYLSEGLKKTIEERRFVTLACRTFALTKPLAW